MGYLKIILISLPILSLSGHAIAQSGFKRGIKKHRAEYKEKFRKDSYSPFYHHPRLMKKMKYYSPREDYMVSCKVELTPNAEPFDLATYSGKTKPFKQYAWLKFELHGNSYKLAIYQNLNTIRNPLYRTYLFLPFKDATSGEETYGGGRYLDFKTSDIQDGQLLLDFNKTYNPYCAYSDGYNCPIPPTENHLPLAIPAGEKMYKGPKLSRP